jgi:N-acetylglucosaminyldiphosphoundecaprenol N-acetyl-beta-D-mannosaminyltransferase
MNQAILFGIKIQLGRFQYLIEKILTDEKGYVCFLNSHMIYEYKTKKEFKSVLDKANYILADGMPVVYSLKFLKGLAQDRIAGNDVVFSLVDKAKNEKLRMFWIGTSHEVLDKISSKLSDIGVSHKTYSPPFKPIEAFDFSNQAEMINEYKPHMVLVGLGCPKQEIWMYNMRDRIQAPMFGIGGAFLLYAGVDTRAPKWMRNLSLEWLYRLILEPKRLFKRYLVTNSYFCFLFIKEFFKKRQ